MDDVQRAFQWLQFKNAFLEKKGKAFEDWFGRLAEFALGTDFERIRPYGAEGDRKADGRSRSDRTIYQCYAPEALKQAPFIAKIERDFAGAVEHWGDWMERWVLVHNDSRGLPPEIVRRLDALRSRHPSVVIETWSEGPLAKLAARLDMAGRELLFGVVPSRGDIEGVVLDDVVEVISYLEQVEPSPTEEPLSAPSVDKIAKNDLSGDVLELLRAAKRKDHLVKRFFEFHPRPNFGEKIAEAFRGRYRELKDSGQLPDDIFVGLQRATGAQGSAKGQVAALAVLSYLFDRCDIFEDPESLA